MNIWNEKVQPEATYWTYKQHSAALMPVLVYINMHGIHVKDAHEPFGMPLGE